MTKPIYLVTVENASFVRNGLMEKEEKLGREAAILIVDPDS